WDGVVVITRSRHARVPQIGDAGRKPRAAIVGSHKLRGASTQEFANQRASLAPWHNRQIMATSSSPAPPSTHLSLARFAPMTSSSPSHISAVPAILVPTLPSLANLLKKMQCVTPPACPLSPSSRVQLSPAAQSLVDFSELAYAQEVCHSPMGHNTIPPMLSLRTMIISPRLTKSSAGAPVHTGSVHITDAITSSPKKQHQQQPQQQQQQKPVALPSRKRTWMEASAAAFFPAKSRSSPSAPPPSAAHLATPSSGSYRTRASKYCKIEGCERVSQRNNLCHSHGGKRLCKKDGCSSKDRGSGYCIKHGGGKICSSGSCEKKARRKGLCTQHFRRSDDESADSAEDSMRRSDLVFATVSNESRFSGLPGRGAVVWLAWCAFALPMHVLRQDKQRTGQRIISSKESGGMSPMVAMDLTIQYASDERNARRNVIINLYHDMDFVMNVK
ncbi:hypothetical protein PybrP1_010412, partial [[Pythium] brassicae (nom. inval.)]